MGASAHAVKKAPREYYLALGDSLSRGSQPNAQGKTGPTSKGYTNDLFAAEKPKFKNLHFVNLGCPGETTTEMLRGGGCHYAAGSQLGTAVQFLHRHKGHIAFVTIDLGADDFRGCYTPTQIHRSCFKAADTLVHQDMPKIAAKLRKAAGSKVPLVGMTYYDPLLADWLADSRGHQQAALSQKLIKRANHEIASAFHTAAFEVADVADSFHTYESLSKTRSYRGHQVPVPVVLICEKTWMCASAPRGPDVHANTSGYLKIAKAFEQERL